MSAITSRRDNVDFDNFAETSNSSCFTNCTGWATFQQTVTVFSEIGDVVQCRAGVITSDSCNGA